MPERLVLASTAQAELTVSRSRFLARLERAATVSEADAVIRAARTAAPGARHHCSAMILEGTEESGRAPMPLTRSSDDGEPAGTAGMPILLALQGAHLVDVVAVVTRHFGGIKLGTGGLARAYGDAVAGALADARLLRRTELAELRLRAPHADAGGAENALRQFAASHAGIVEDSRYDAAGAELTILLPPAHVAALEADVAAWSAGRLSPVPAGTRTLDVPL
ncbi:IMPACT family protein [Brachybacterium huguangmaarense]